MRRAAASCVPYVVACLFLSACGFPDYSFAPAKLQGPDGGGGRDASSLDAAGRGGTGGRSGSGGTVTGGVPPVDAADAHRECTVNGDCAASPGGPLCSAEGRCVECRTGFPDCPPGSRCTPEHLCETGCNTNADCVGAPSADAGTVKDSGADSASHDASRDSATPADAARESGSGSVTDAHAVDAHADADGTDARDATSKDSGLRMVCDVATHSCTGCLRDDDCPPGAFCEVALARCMPTCSAARPCPTGFSCCGGECFNDRHTAEHCGGCATSCVEDAGRGACVAGKCRSGLCSQGRGDCNGNVRDGCETNLDFDPSNCGTCGHECPTPQNASPICRNGECAVGACNPGFANCDGVLSATNACEANLVTNRLDPKNCGTCGFACNLLNANPECVDSACQITNCEAGFSDCDKLTSTGCEVHTLSDPSNCGACGKVCSFPNADSSCSNSVCRLGACIPPSVNCNGIASDGCEINTDSDPDNCGTCAKHCALANATAACAGGSCVVESCNSGFADCDGDPKNGCETNTNTNAKNCGACGKPCSTNHGTASCALGACSIACIGSFKDCDSDASNGCETDTSSNVDTCGSCTKVCPTVGGGAANCVGGNCGISTCSGTLADCNGSASDGCEVETATSVNNCGGCGKACFVANGTAGCAGGQCTITSCAAGYDDCNGDPSDGCEERLNTLTRCGACNKACSLPNANESCISGKCEVTSCVSPYADCDGDPSNGCEIDTTGSVANCGGCDNACDNTNGTAECLNGSCFIKCNAGFANCNAAVSDGCERVTRNDVNNCGACGAVCAVQNGKPVCNNTTCAIQSCTAPFADCDHAYATGCETNTDTRIDNCGACGHVCDTSKGTPTCTAGVCILPP